MLLSLLNLHSTRTSAHSEMWLNGRVHNLKSSAPPALLPNLVLIGVRAPAAPALVWLGCVVTRPAGPARLLCSACRRARAGRIGDRRWSVHTAVRWSAP